MNTELYESLVRQIKDKLELYAFIDIPKSVLEDIRTMLSSELFINCKIKKDFDEKNYGAIMMAFYYETSRKYPVFNFLTPFYANFFDIGNNEIKIKSVIEKIKENEIYYNAFFEIARVDVIKKVYAYMKKNLNNVGENKEFYQKVMEKIESLGIEQKAVIIDSGPLNYNDIEKEIQNIDESAEHIITHPFEKDVLLNETNSEKLENLYAKKEELEKLAAQRKDELFTEAALNLGVTKEEFENETGGKDLNLDIDRIVIMPKVLKNVSPIKSLNQTGLKKLIERNRRKRFLGSLDFDYVTKDNLNTLIVKPMNTLFDKIASGDKPSIDGVIKNASRKEKIASVITFISYDEFSKILGELAKNYDPEVASEYKDVLSIVNEKEHFNNEYIENSIKVQEVDKEYKGTGEKTDLPVSKSNSVFETELSLYNSEDYSDIIPEYKDGEPKFILKPVDDSGNEPGGNGIIDTGIPTK